MIGPDDPLAEVAAKWQAMWELPGGPDAAVAFEERAADTLAAWRSKRFELPDYYLVVAPAQPEAAAPDLYLGPLRAVRPHRVAVAAVTQEPVKPAEFAVVPSSLSSVPWLTVASISTRRSEA
jgi:hypothetical protein